MREEIKSFRFTGYSFEEKEKTAILAYAFDDEFTFVETIKFENAPELSPERREALELCLKYLHLAAGVSYFKAFLAPELVIETSPLTVDEAKFFTDFYKKGLGEFCHRNNVRLPDSFGFKAEAKEPIKPAKIKLNSQMIVPVGGGKDSAVTTEILREIKPDLKLFSVGRPRPIKDSIAVSGLGSIMVTRKISPVLLEINQKAQELGAYNGHVPVTGIIAFILACAAVIYDFDEVAMSNERSANVGNLTWDDGFSVNHQWSKSFEFENAFKKLMDKVLPDFRYFSFLRPLSELAIAKKFATLNKYHTVFTSCNRAFTLDPKRRIDRWCCDCDKCRFVFLSLAPFIKKGELVLAFGANLLGDPAQLAGYRELLGLAGHKPFECVGETEECLAALYLLAQTAEWKYDPLLARLLDEAKAKHGDISRFVEPAFALASEGLLTPKYKELINAHFCA